MMKKKKLKYQEIIDGKWDYLIILDACRYDYFKKVYKDYLNGKLECRLSRGSHTFEWAKKTFTKKLDNVTYISTTPFINSLGKKIDKNFFWNANNYFDKIIDVWDLGWDENLETVPPWTVNKFVKENKDKSDRMIIHYMQPHQPFIGYKKGKRKGENKKTRDFMRSIREKIISLPFWYKIDQKNKWKIRKILNWKSTDFQKLHLNGEDEKLRFFYEKNLRMVLKYTSKIIKLLKGKIIVTADHGEGLGENGDWEHKIGSKNPVLRKVPWLIVEGVK